MKNLRKAIAKTTFELQLNAWLKTLMVGMSLALIGLSLQFPVPVLLMFSGLGVILAFFHYRIFEIRTHQAARVLHQDLPSLEYSLELLEQKNSSPIAQLQLSRVDQLIQGYKLPSYWHRGLGGFALILFILILTCWVLGSFSGRETGISPSNQKESVIGVTENAGNLAIAAVSIQIQPPKYTQLKPIETSDFEIKAIRGTEVTWKLRLEGAEAAQVFMVDEKGAQLPFAQDGQQYQLKDKVLNSGIYAIRVQQGEEVMLNTPFYPITVTLDQKPLIEPTQKEIYTLYQKKSKSLIKLEATVSDDFGVEEVFVVATLARGTGENVRFRESKIPFSQRNFKKSTLSTGLDLKKLDFSPGDELYYYWVAIDNKRPEPNIARSDTYFIQYKDMESLSDAELTTMAVDIMPEYFRSQRQIIIDTKKLIGDKSKLETQKFKENSNEIGFDQKVLRLRYGQFLGEEFESTAGGDMISPAADDGALLEGYIHDHDHDEEGHDHHDHDHHDHGHSHSSGDLSGEEDPMQALLEQYLHIHDTEDENTYFDQSTRSLLKAALEEMWQSELYLRLYQPEEALPYQEKALQYLKTVQQKSRAFVKRTGFDPAPIKIDEKRLTGELKAISPTPGKQLYMEENDFARLAAESLGLLEKKNLSQQEKAKIQILGEQWSARLLEAGTGDWTALIHLQKWLAEGELSESEKRALGLKLSAFIPSNPQSKSQTPASASLSTAFWKNLQ